MENKITKKKNNDKITKEQKKKNKERKKKLKNGEWMYDFVNVHILREY